MKRNQLLNIAAITGNGRPADGQKLRARGSKANHCVKHCYDRCQPILGDAEPVVH